MSIQRTTFYFAAQQKTPAEQAEVLQTLYSLHSERSRYAIPSQSLLANASLLYRQPKLLTQCTVTCPLFLLDGLVHIIHGMMHDVRILQDLRLPHKTVALYISLALVKQDSPLPHCRTVSSDLLPKISSQTIPQNHTCTLIHLCKPIVLSP